jgi:hypothetical protein
MVIRVAHCKKNFKLKAEALGFTKKVTKQL